MTASIRTRHMKWEYETAWPYIKNNGMLLSDDTNWSMGAFDEFAKKKWFLQYSVKARWKKSRNIWDDNKMMFCFFYIFCKPLKW